MARKGKILDVFKNKDNYLYPITVTKNGVSSIICPDIDDEDDKKELSLKDQARQVFNKVKLALLMSGISSRRPLEITVHLNSKKYEKRFFTDLPLIFNLHLTDWPDKINSTKDSTLPEGVLIAASFKVMKRSLKKKPAPSQ